MACLDCSSRETALESLVQLLGKSSHEFRSFSTHELEVDALDRRVVPIAFGMATEASTPQTFKSTQEQRFEPPKQRDAEPENGELGE